MAPNLRSIFGTIDLSYCFFHSQEWENGQNPTKISKMLKNKLYHDIKLTPKRFHWIANYRISSTDSKLEPPYKDSIILSETKMVENNRRL